MSQVLNLKFMGRLEWTNVVTSPTNLRRYMCVSWKKVWLRVQIIFSMSVELAWK